MAKKIFTILRSIFFYLNLCNNIIHFFWLQPPTAFTKGTIADAEPGLIIFKEKNVDRIQLASKETERSFSIKGGQDACAALVRPPDKSANYK